MKSTMRIEVLLFVAMFINMHAQTSAATCDTSTPAFPCECGWLDAACWGKKTQKAVKDKTAALTAAASDKYTYTTEAIAQKTQAVVLGKVTGAAALATGVSLLSDADCKAIIKTELDTQKVAYEKTTFTKEQHFELYKELTQECTAMQQELGNQVGRANNDLQTANNDLQTANSGLQTANNDLQTARNSLQTANSDLQTANSGLQTANNDLQTANNDLQTARNSLAAANSAVRTRNCMKSVQYNMWCNHDKVAADDAVSNGTTPDECISRCIASASCGFVGFRKTDSYCEFWKPKTAGTCYNPHPVVGHNVYEVDETCNQNTAVVYAGALKAGDEKEAEANVVDANPAAAATNNQPTADAEVARTVFEGIIAITFLYIAYTVGAKSQPPESGIIANTVEISEI